MTKHNGKKMAQAVDLYLAGSSMDSASRQAGVSNRSLRAELTSRGLMRSAAENAKLRGSRPGTMPVEAVELREAAPYTLAHQLFNRRVCNP